MAGAQSYDTEDNALGMTVFTEDSETRSMLGYPGLH